MKVYVICLSAAVGLWFLARRFASQCEPVPPPKTDTGVWLDERDQVHFAGMFVGVDAETNEIMSWSSRRELVERDLAKNHHERRCHIISVPGKVSDELRVLIDVGPCKPDDGTNEPWCEGRR